MCTSRDAPLDLDLVPCSPLRDDEWDGIRNAKEDPPACPQNVEGQMRNVTLDLQEDCLYLNVYAPQVSNPTLLPA